MTCNCIYKGDDAPEIITIDFENPEGYIINKLYTTCGNVSHVYNNPVFPFKEGYNGAETEKFETINHFYAGVEIEGIGNVTLNGSITFRACPKVIDWGAHE